jgi:hypothetical protein
MARTQLTAHVLALFSGVMALLVLAACSSDASPAGDPTQAHAELASALDLAVSSVATPIEWEVEEVPIDSYAGGIGYRSSPDLSSSGTWMIVSVSPAVFSEDGSSPEDRFWRFVEGIEAQGQLEIVGEPTATSSSGLHGFEYELSGGVGDRTGQELGGYLAIFFGPEYTYEVIAQFELPDRDSMGVHFRNTLAHLTLTGAEESL